MRKNLVVFSFLAFAFILPSCLAVKSYKQPEIETKELYRADSAFIADSINNMALFSWDRMFADPILQQYIRKGLDHNFDIKTVAQDLLSAEAQMKQSKNIYYPNINGNVQWTNQVLPRNSLLGRVLNGSLNQYELSVGVSWEADIWGKLRSAKRAGIAAFLRTEAFAKAVQTELVANIAMTYYQLLSLDKQLAIAQETLKNRIESVKTIRSLKEAGNGSTTEVAVLQTLAQQYETEIAIKNLAYNIKIAENTFCILLGESPHTVERGNLESQELDKNIRIGLPAQLLSNRPDVMQAELNFRNAFELTNIAKSNFYPSLTISPTGGFQSLDLSNFFSVNSLFSNVVSGLAQPIFNKRRIRTAYEAAKANQEKALIGFQQALINAGKEVSDGLADYENEAVKFDILQAQVETLKKAADYSDRLLQYGMATYLEVLTAKNNYLNAQLNSVENQYRKMKSIIYIYKALGGGYR